MSGIILFVDDKVFDLDSNENRLYLNLREKAEYPVLPLKDLSEFDTAISSISSIKAIVLDWEFIKDTDPDIEGIDLPPDNPESILEKRVFSLVYVFTHKTIGETTKLKLRELYKNKITFKNKEDIAKTEKYTKKIINDIKQMEKRNVGLKVPFIWNQQINGTVQDIFWELESEDPTWINEFYNVALQDIQPEKEKQDENEKIAASKEVISLFSTLLTEKLMSNRDISTSIIEEKQSNTGFNEERYFNLLKYLYFKQIQDKEPISTGIVVVYKKKQLVIISPECDFKYLLKNPDESYVDCLEFSNTPFSKLPNYSKKEKTKVFIKVDPRFYVLPFNYSDKLIKPKPIIIDFKIGYRSIKTSQILSSTKKFKILMPYINDIRQRFLSYKGRIGLPAISDKLKATIASHLEV